MISAGIQRARRPFAASFDYLKGYVCLTFTFPPEQKKRFPAGHTYGARMLHPSNPPEQLVDVWSKCENKRGEYHEIRDTYVCIYHRKPIASTKYKANKKRGNTTHLLS